MASPLVYLVNVWLCLLLKCVNAAHRILTHSRKLVVQGGYARGDCGLCACNRLDHNCTDSDKTIAFIMVVTATSCLQAEVRSMRWIPWDWDALMTASQMLVGRSLYLLPCRVRNFWLRLLRQRSAGRVATSSCSE